MTILARRPRLAKSRLAPRPHLIPTAADLAPEPADAWPAWTDLPLDLMVPILASTDDPGRAVVLAMRQVAALERVATAGRYVPPGRIDGAGVEGGVL